MAAVTPTELGSQIDQPKVDDGQGFEAQILQRLGGDLGSHKSMTIPVANPKPRFGNWLLRKVSGEKPWSRQAAFKRLSRMGRVSGKTFFR